jgi:hypothetical protein
LSLEADYSQSPSVKQLISSIPTTQAGRWAGARTPQNGGKRCAAKYSVGQEAVESARVDREKSSLISGSERTCSRSGNRFSGGMGNLRKLGCYYSSKRS